MESEVEGDLVYACLELRMAIERHVYEKLKFYSKRHGTKLLHKSWQPDQALKLLCQLEPSGDQSYTLAFEEDDSSDNPKTGFQQFGKHEALSAKWTRKNYNKLGSYLHLQQDGTGVLNTDKEKLEPIYQELLRVASSNVTINIAETRHFNCQLCESKITSCVEALPELDLVYCPNNKCNATYLPKYRENKWQFIINATDFECPGCSGKQLVLENELKIRALITCRLCKQRYVIASHNYGLQKYQS